MPPRGLAAGLLLVVLASAAPAAERFADPTRAFVEGHDPSQNDFFANTPERTVLLRIRDDFDGDGVGDLALSESSTWGNAGGQWLLFRGQRGGEYLYWGTLFFSPGSLAIGPRPGDVTAYVRVAASRGSLRVHRLGSETIALERDRPLDLERPAIGRRMRRASPQGGGRRSNTASSWRIAAIRRAAGGRDSGCSLSRYTCRP
jgi:hypothetical protein